MSISFDQEVCILELKSLKMELLVFGVINVYVYYIRKRIVVKLVAIFRLCVKVHNTSITFCTSTQLL